MDSQEQYEALLRRWGLEDRSAERRARRQKIVRQAKAAYAFCKKMASYSRKAVFQSAATH